MSLKEPMTCCVPNVKQGVVPSSHQSTTYNTMIYHRDEEAIPNFNQVLTQGTTCSQISLNCKNLKEQYEFQHLDSRTLFGAAHAHTSNNINYCHADVKEHGVGSNFTNTYLESQIRHAPISREMEMNAPQYMDNAFLSSHHLNELNSPHLSRCNKYIQDHIDNNRSMQDEEYCGESHSSSTVGQNEVLPPFSTIASKELKRYSTSPPPTQQHSIIRNSLKLNEGYSKQALGQDLKGYTYCLNDEKNFHTPNTDLNTTNKDITNYRPSHEYAPTSQLSLKSEEPTTKHNNYRGGNANQSRSFIGIANSDANHALRFPQRQQTSYLTQPTSNAESTSAIVHDDDDGEHNNPQQGNDTNRSTKFSFAHPQQMQKQHQPEMNPVGCGSFAQLNLMNVGGVSANTMNSSSTMANGTNNMMNGNQPSSSSTLYSSSTTTSNMYSSRQSTTPPTNNVQSSSSSSPYNPMISQHYSTNYNRNVISTPSLRDDVLIQNHSASSLLLSEQQLIQHHHQQQSTCIDSRILVAASVPVVQGCNERIHTIPQSPMHYPSIPNSSSSSSLQGVKKQRATSTVTASTNISQQFSTCSNPQQATQIQPNNNKPLTTNIKFHLLDDPNLKQDEHRSNFVRIDEEQIRKVFHLTQRQAAAFLGVSLSTLKRRFYEMRESLGMDKWPTTGNGTTTLVTVPTTTASSAGTTPTNTSSNNTSRNNKGSRKNSLASDQALGVPSTPHNNLNEIHSPYHYSLNDPSSRRPSVTSQDEYNSQSIPNNGNSSMNQSNNYPYISQQPINLPPVNISLPPMVNSNFSNPSPQSQLAKNENLDNFLSRYTPKSFDDIAQDIDKCLPNSSLKRRTNVYGHGHDPILIAKMFSDEPATTNPRKRSYPNISPNEIKELDKQDGFPTQIPRHSSFSSQGSIDGSIEPPRKVIKSFPVNKRGSTDENAEPKSNMSFILNEGVKDPTHLDKEEWNTLMEAFKKQ